MFSTPNITICMSLLNKTIASLDFYKKSENITIRCLNKSSNIRKLEILAFPQNKHPQNQNIKEGTVSALKKKQ